MKEKVWQKKQLNKLFTLGKMPNTKIKETYQSLLNQYSTISEEVVNSINRNDYIKFSQLIIARRKIETAIQEIESFHADELNNHISTIERMVKTRIAAISFIKYRSMTLLFNAANIFYKRS